MNFMMIYTVFGCDRTQSVNGNTGTVTPIPAEKSIATARRSVKYVFECLRMVPDP